jgi:hypothetical protein
MDCVEYGRSGVYLRMREVRGRIVGVRTSIALTDKERLETTRFCNLLPSSCRSWTPTKLLEEWRWRLVLGSSNGL